LSQFPFNKDPNELKSIIAQALLDNTSESIYFKDLDSKFVALSKYQLKLFNVDSAEECIGKSDFDYFTKEHAQRAYNDEQEIIRTGKPILGKIEQETWAGDLVSYVVSSKYPLYDHEGNIIGTWGHSLSVASVNDNKETKQQRIKKEMIKNDFSSDSRIDNLTNLKNAKAFYEIMNLFYQEAMNSMSVPNKEHVLILVNMNNFKELNSNYGHKYGDKALAFASMLMKKVESNTTRLFRYGGDEFSILIEKTTYEECIDIANSILELFAKHKFKSDGTEIQLTASIGVSRFKESLPFGNIHDIINLTGKRLYAAKKLNKPSVISDNTYRL
jgi:diguanylate cyclase (GGDEF)-like protein